MGIFSFHFPPLEDNQKNKNGKPPVFSIHLYFILAQNRIFGKRNYSLAARRIMPAPNVRKIFAKNADLIFPSFEKLTQSDREVIILN